MKMYFANGMLLHLVVYFWSMSWCQADIVLLGPTKPVQEQSSMEFYCILEKSTNADNIIMEKYYEDESKFKNMSISSESRNQTSGDVIFKPVNLTDKSHCLAVCVKNVSNDNSGRYRCRSGEKISSEVEVRVHEPNQNFDQQYRRCLGLKSSSSMDNVTLMCISRTNGLEEQRPQWFKNGSEVVPEGNFLNISLGSSNISFVSVETAQGVYSCGVQGEEDNLSCEVSFSSVLVSIENYADKSVGINAFVSLNSDQMTFIDEIDSFKISSSVCHVEKNLFFSKVYTSKSEAEILSTGSIPTTSAGYVTIIISSIYASLSAILFIIVLVRFIRRRVRLWKLSHIYATFNPAVAPLAEIPRRNLSRRPTRSLPPIPTEDAAKPDAHYANAHLKLSQHSLPAHFRHSMQSFPSDSTVWKAGCRNSLPLNASNVSAQNALYFFTDTVEECDEMKECMEDKPAVIPYTISESKPQPPKPFFKHHTMNVRSSTMVGKPRASDYQNWFQRFKLSTSCPSIAGMEETEEVKPKPEIICQAKISFEKWKRRTQIRRRLSSIYRERTPPPVAPPSFLPTLQRPFSESFAQSENPYVERSNTISSCYSK